MVSFLNKETGAQSECKAVFIALKGDFIKSNVNAIELFVLQGHLKSNPTNLK